MRKLSYLFRKLEGNKVQCLTCSHFCVLEETQRGKCGVRVNKKGELYFLLYEKACSANIDPIEKKPFYHFLPQSFSFSFATVGCNFACLNCQNWEISQAPKEENLKEEEIERMGFDLKVEEIVKKAKENGCQSISYTYTEPTIFLEYALDVMKLAKKEGLKNVWVSNGFMSPQTIDLISPYLDAINIDLKFFDDDLYQKMAQGRLLPVLNSIKEFKKRKVWVELTTLIIPGVSDQEEMIKKMAHFIKNEVGPETPWHLSAFCGAISWKMKDVPDTPRETVERLCQVAQREGIFYVYAGNLFGSPFENTYCPRCKELVIKREGYFVERKDKEGRCPKCGFKLDLILS